MSYPSTEEIMWYKQALKSRRHSAERKKLATRPLHTSAVTAGYRLQHVTVATNLSWQELIGSCNIHGLLIAVLSSG